MSAASPPCLPPAFGPIICSEPSARLLPLVLEDAYKHGVTAEPVLVERYLEFLEKLITPVPFDQWHPVVKAKRCSAAPVCRGPAICSVRPMWSVMFAKPICRTVPESSSPAIWTLVTTLCSNPCGRRSGQNCWCSKVLMVIACIQIAANGGSVRFFVCGPVTACRQAGPDFHQVGLMNRSPYKIAN